jgi:hypothetical protein
MSTPTINFKISQARSIIEKEPDYLTSALLELRVAHGSLIWQDKEKPNIGVALDNAIFYLEKEIEKRPNTAIYCLPPKKLEPVSNTKPKRWWNRLF